MSDVAKARRQDIFQRQERISGVFCETAILQRLKLIDWS